MFTFPEGIIIVLKKNCAGVAIHSRVDHINLIGVMEEFAMAVKKTQTPASSSRGRKSGSTANRASTMDVSVQAYYLYLNRMKNNSPGNDLSDWLEAERLVRSSAKEDRL